MFNLWRVLLHLHFLSIRREAPSVILGFSGEAIRPKEPSSRKTELGVKDGTNEWLEGPEKQFGYPRAPRNISLCLQQGPKREDLGLRTKEVVGPPDVCLSSSECHLYGRYLQGNQKPCGADLCSTCYKDNSDNMSTSAQFPFLAEPKKCILSPARVRGWGTQGEQAKWREYATR